jgi:hypothetical protein
MKNYRTILCIGIIEILIGVVTILANIFMLTFSVNTKTPTVLLFVIIAGTTSTLTRILSFGQNPPEGPTEKISPRFFQACRG